MSVSGDTAPYHRITISSPKKRRTTRVEVDGLDCVRVVGKWIFPCDDERWFDESIDGNPHRGQVALHLKRHLLLAFVYDHDLRETGCATKPHFC